MEDIKQMPDGKRLYRIDAIIVDHDFNCRGKIAPIDVAELAKDIKNNGLIQPVVIQTLSAQDQADNPGKVWKLIAGFRRITACRINELGYVWATVHETANEDDARFFNLRENLQRENLSFSQEAKAIAPLLAKGLSRESIADRLGMSPGWAQMRTQYLTLPKEFQDAYDEGGLTQPNLRSIYGAYKKGGVEAATIVMRDLKDAKMKGLKRVPKSVKALQEQTGDITDINKHIRAKVEMMDMQDRLYNMLGPSFTTRVLAWCCGYISNDDLEADIKRMAGDKYTDPDSYVVP